LARSKQSLKRHRNDEVKNERNHRKLRRLRTALKKVQSSETPEEKAEAVKLAQSLLDRAGRTRLIHPNKADRLKSRAL
jgi:small subunit ribosomal protein S20